MRVRRQSRSLGTDRLGKGLAVFIPYRVDVPMSRPPVMNWVLMVAIVAVSILAWKSEKNADSPIPPRMRPVLFLFDRRLSDEQKTERLCEMGKTREEAATLLNTMKEAAKTSPDEYRGLCDIASSYDHDPTIYEQMVLRGWSLKGLIGHMFLHGGFLHLAGNMLFLWLFGNAICAKVGNLWYPAIFIVVGLAAGAAQLLLSPAAAIGASGAINGVVGMYVVLYPLNEISCFYLLFFGVIFRTGFFAVSGVWLILMWLAFDIWGVVSKGEGIAYFAHIGGFAAGFVLASVLLLTRLVKVDRGEKTLYEVFGMNVTGADAAAPSEPTAARAPRVIPADDVRSRPYRPPAPPEPIPLAEDPPAGIGSPPTGPVSAPPADFLRLRCKCGQTFRVSREMAGKVFSCSSCGRRARIPTTW